MEGEISKEYLVIPRNKGKYEIPSVEFAYFDTTIGEYKMVKSNPISISVEQNGEESYNEKVGDYEIHPIMKRRNLQPNKMDFFGSKLYYGILVSLIFAFLCLIFAFRKIAISQADTIGQRGRHANKIAVRRLKQAKTLMEKKEPDKFYEETLRVLWGYISDKLNIPTENLNRENVKHELGMRKITPSSVDKFIYALEECEFERYAPGDISGNMNKTYEVARLAIIEVEEMLNKKSLSKRFSAQVDKEHLNGVNLISICLFILCLSSTSLNAATYETKLLKADSLYENGDYQKAIDEYLDIIGDNGDGTIFYNLGCASYHPGLIGKSILYFEKASKLTPGNKDVIHNLRLAYQKTIEKSRVQPNFALINALNMISAKVSVDSWAYISIAFIIVSMSCFLLYLFSTSYLFNTWGLRISICSLIISLISIFLAYNRKHVLNTSNWAIVLTEEVNLKQIPSSQSKSILTIHEGSALRIEDREKEGWLKVSTPSGKEGWIEIKYVGEV